MRKFKSIAIVKNVCLLPGICFVAAVMITSLQVSLAAKDDNPVQLTATNVRVTSFSSVSVDSLDNSKIGVVETLRKPGHVILLVEMDVEAAWTEKTGGISFYNIVLIGKDGESLPVIGTFSFGRFNDGRPSLYVKQSSKWPGENPPTTLNVVFLVPVGSGPYTLTSLSADHGLSVPIVVPTKIAHEPHISNKMSVKVTSAKLVEALESTQFRVGKDKTSTRIVNPGGKFLEVTFDLTPNDSNGPFTDKFFWTTNWFGVRYNGKFHSHTIGEAWVKGSISWGVSHNTNILNGQGDTDTVTFYFPVTADAKTFELLCLMREVAKGTVAEN